MCLAVVLDLFSRRIVGWAMSNRINTRLTVDAMTMALSHRRPDEGLVHHSDRGCQYMLRLSYAPTGEQMGQAAEKMAKLNAISHQQQDEIAYRSHHNAAGAWKEGVYDQEVITLFPAPYDNPVSRDNIVRDDSSVEALAKLRPVFDRKHGTITAGLSQQKPLQ